MLAVGHDMTEVEHREEALALRGRASSLITDGRVDLDTVLQRWSSKPASAGSEADGANIFQRDGEVFRVTASHGYSPELTRLHERQAVKPLTRQSLSGRNVIERRVVQHSRRAG